VRGRGRRLVVALAVVGVSGGVLAGLAAAQSVTVSCDSPSGHDTCDRWYRSASVFLDWNVDPQPVPTSVTGCVGGLFTTEARVVSTCKVVWPGTTVTKDVWIGIDRTPPQLVALTPNRPADYNGWFNRPVGLTFRAVDKTSGVASCSSTSYGGPDALGVAIPGSCTDVAGNTASGSFPLNYDATPPPRPSVEALPGNRRVTIAWTPSPGAQAAVFRIRTHRAPKLLYLGSNAHFTHRKLHNGRRYRYRITLIDQAGNRSSDRASAVPIRSPLLRPANGVHVRDAPLLVWKRVRRASYYNAQLVRGGTKILSSWPREPHLQLRLRWRFNGHVRRLVPGRYCWYVWPGIGARSERRYGRQLGKSCFRVVR
jgi:hypothetical protein